MTRPHLIHSPVFERATAGNPLTLVDVGARGQLDPPWDTIAPAALQVIGFEPDAKECARLSAQTPANMRFLPVALWSHHTDIEVHVAMTPSCSSVHPPNADVLSRFAEEHAAPRTTRTTELYPARALDEVLPAEHLVCDFLKIDTQGAEGEVIRGASQTLSDQSLGALIETWTIDVHRGQELTGAVMTRMHELGFELFDIGVAAAWRRRSTDRLEPPGKSQVVGLDLLYLRDPRSITREGDQQLQLLKTAALAEVFGFPDFALELLDGASDAVWWSDARDAVVSAARARRSPARRLQRLVRRVQSRPSEDFAPLHA